VADVVVTATSIEFNHDYVATTDSDGAFFIPVPGPLAASPIAYSVKTALMTDPPTQVVDVEPGCSDAVDVEAFSLRSAGGTGPNGT
jgi:hypothetical protein